jgi:serine/threonine protein kinase/tetratricopeptide (TPR) repeat protein
MRFAPGTRLGPYHLLAFLAAGGMGEVYKARDMRLGREVAVKVLPADKLTDADRRSRLLREARAASILNHPNIVTVHDIAEFNGVLFIVMELVPGRPLTHCIPLEVGLAVRVASQIAAAVARAHSAGIAHRDLKPANVMLTDEGIVKVLDFGLAKLDEPAAPNEDAVTITQTQAGVIMGTPAYMSPEQAQGGRADRRSDIFSFGLLVYEVLTGRRASSGGSPAAVAPLRDTVPQVSTALERIVARCLEQDPAMRYQSMIDVKVALEAVTAGGPGAAALSSVAVLPFVNMSSEVDNEHFGDGLSDELIRLLGQWPDLRVTARTSSFSFRGKDLPAGVIGRVLQVDYLVEGSVRRADRRIRVTARLITSADGFQCWSERYEGDVTDVFTIQDEIAEAIARSLKSRFTKSGPEANRMRNNPNVDAYNLCLKARYHLYKYTPAAMSKAKECFEAAIDLDPDYAAAYSGLGMYHFCTLDERNIGREYSTRVAPLVQKALELDPALSEAHALRGSNLAVISYDWPNAEREFQQALTAPSVPSDVYYHYVLNILLPLGRFTDALHAIDKARQIDPLVPTYLKAPVYACIGDYPKVIEDCGAALDLDAHYWPAKVQQAWGHFELGRIDEALSTFQSLQSFLGAENWIVLHGIGACLSALDRPQEAREVLDGMVTRNAASWNIGLMCHLIGDRQAGFEWMNRAIDERDPRMFQFVRTFRFATSLADDARFLALLERMNLLPLLYNPVQSKPW